MNDRTIIRPGGRRPRNSQNQDRSAQAGGRSGRNKINLASLAREQSHRDVNQPSSLFRKFQPRTNDIQETFELDNPILGLVSPLILLVSKSKTAQSKIDLAELREHATKEIEYYRSISFGMESPFAELEQVSYGLCCLLDEIVMNTPWGAKSDWSSESLLVVFHKEAWGGERFFSQLGKMCENPSQYLNVIEFYYALLELGFEGKYRQSTNGIREHQIVKNNTYLVIEKYRQLEPQPLSVKWEGAYDSQDALLKSIPQWVIWSTSLGLALSVFFVFSLLLSYQTDPVKRRLVSLVDKNIVKTTPRNLFSLTNSYSAQPDLAAANGKLFDLLSTAFQAEINQGLLILEERPKGISIRLTNAKLFGSGSDKLADTYVTLIKNLAPIITDKKVRVEITGHSDDIPIRTLKYPDNWALSEARALSVKNILDPLLNKSTQVFARGLADTLNLVPNTSAENRSLNRRVEILIRN